MKVQAGLIAIAAALSATPTLAQVRGEARAEGDALLAQAAASGVFDNITTDEAQDIKLRHKASGLICEFNLGAPSNRVVVFDGGQAGAKRGDDVACSTDGEVGERARMALLHLCQIVGEGVGQGAARGA